MPLTALRDALPAFALPLHSVRLGPLRLTPYGCCAAVGLVAATALATRTARHFGVVPEAAADAGLFAVASCFVTSRLLLVLTNFRAFLRYPLALLGLPSLTLGGMALAALAVGVYLRRERLGLLRMLDVFAAPGAVLAACLEMGHLLDGSELGMPLRLDWISASSFRAAVPAHPVALYGTGCAALLAELLWALTRRAWVPGRVAAVALLVGGLLAFALDMVSLPEDPLSTLPLEPGQMVALGAMVSGVLLWVWSHRRKASHSSGAAAILNEASVPAAVVLEKR